MNEFLSLFAYPFVWRALIVGVLIALSAALLGVILVLRRFSFIGDGLSHVAFGATAIAAVVGLTDRLWLVLPVTVLSAVLILGLGRSVKIRGDAAIAVLSVGALGVGYFLLHLFPPTQNIAGDVCGTLFGTTAILTLSDLDLFLCVGLCLAVLLTFVFFYRWIFSVSFDESFAHAGGMPVGRMNLLLSILTAVVVVVAMRLVGSLLISALLVFPALTAMRLFRSFRAVVIASAVCGVCGAVAGLLLSLLFSTPVGATVVCVDLVLFLVSLLFRRS